eukprot:gene751-biopygen1496
MEPAAGEQHQHLRKGKFVRLLPMYPSAALCHCHTHLTGACWVLHTLHGLQGAACSRNVAHANADDFELHCWSSRSQRLCHALEARSAGTVSSGTGMSFNSAARRCSSSYHDSSVAAAAAAAAAAGGGGCCCCALTKSGPACSAAEAGTDVYPLCRLGVLAAAGALEVRLALLLVPLLLAEIQPGPLDLRLEGTCGPEARNSLTLASTSSSKVSSTEGNITLFRSPHSPAFEAEVRALTLQEHGKSARDQQAAWQAAAHANLTAFRLSILESVQYSGNRPFKRAMWPLFAPVVSCPPGRPLKRYPDAMEDQNHGDGQKLLCSLGDEAAQTVGCVIYSMGSNGDYQFEDSMLASTKCEIHTFDCTYDGTSRDVKRHFYHKWCVGTVPGKPEYMSLRQVMAKLGHQQVHLMKIDVEGYEYPVLAEMRPTDPLPTEIAIEVHIGWRLKSPSSSGELALVWLHLASLGYATYAYEVNEYIPDEGCEFSFIRVNAGSRPASDGRAYTVAPQLPMIETSQLHQTPSQASNATVVAAAAPVVQVTVLKTTQQAVQNSNEEPAAVLQAAALRAAAVQAAARLRAAAQQAAAQQAAKPLIAGLVPAAVLQAAALQQAALQAEHALAAAKPSAAKVLSKPSPVAANPAAAARKAAGPTSAALKAAGPIAMVRKTAVPTGVARITAGPAPTARKFAGPTAVARNTAVPLAAATYNAGPAAGARAAAGPAAAREAARRAAAARAGAVAVAAARRRAAARPAARARATAGPAAARAVARPAASVEAGAGRAAPGARAAARPAAAHTAARRVAVFVPAAKWLVQQQGQ